METDKVLAGARIDRPLWNQFAGAAKARGVTVAEALEEALRTALKKTLAQGRGPATAAGKTNAR